MNLYLKQSSYSIYTPHAFTPQAKDLSKYSGSLNIDLYDASDSPIKVTQASEPISMKVPLDRNMPVPGEEYVVPFIPDRDWEYFFYHTTEITSSRSALQIRFRLEDLNQQFLVLVKFGDIKNISKAFDHVCMVPSKMEYKGLWNCLITVTENLDQGLMNHAKIIVFVSKLNIFGNDNHHEIGTY